MTGSPANGSLRGELRRNEVLARYTSWRVGGPARQLYRPADIADLQHFLRSLPADEQVLWLGLGSNLLVRDGGFEGSVILTQSGLNAVRFVEPDRIHAEAGAACAQVARQAARTGLAGAAFFAGIPGTMGGALAMNAGAFGGETWECVRSVRTIDRAGRVRERTPQDYRIAYRDVRGPAGEWFVDCELQLTVGESAAELQRIRELLARRAETQPTGKPSGGSTFRNPPGDFAARLIEQAGLKDASIGGARVSAKHANFVINTGAATAADIEALIERMRTEVKAQFGVELVPEVRIVGVAS